VIQQLKIKIKCWSKPRQKQFAVAAFSDDTYPAIPYQKSKNNNLLAEANTTKMLTSSE
jgi:hypothetical protein